MLGDRIRQLRKDRGWSQRELARRSMLTRSCLRHIEEQRRPRPYVESVMLIAMAFNMTMEELIGDPGNLSLSAVRVSKIRSLSAYFGGDPVHRDIVFRGAE